MIMAFNYFIIIILCFVTVRSTPLKQEVGRDKRDDSYEMECCLCDDFDHHRNRHCSEKRCLNDLYSSERRLIAQCEYCQYTKVYRNGKWKIRGQCSIEPLCRHDFARTISTPGCFGIGTPSEGTLCDYCCRRPGLFDPYDYCINGTMSGFSKFSTFSGVSKATPVPPVATTSISTPTTTPSSTTKYITTPSSTLRSSTLSPTSSSKLSRISTSTSSTSATTGFTMSTTTKSSSTHTVALSPFVCSVCDAKDGRNCNDRTDSCPTGMCQNRLTFQGNGAIQHVVKSCVPDILCKVNTENNDPSCKEASTNQSLPLQTVCTYCCDPQAAMVTKDPCNSNLYAVTEPKPVCSVCDSWGGRNCNYKTELCSSGICQNRITFKNNGDIQHVLKSCVPDILCKVNMQNNDPSCEDALRNQSLPLGTVCSYCCDPHTNTSTQNPCNTNLYTHYGDLSTDTTPSSSTVPATNSSRLTTDQFRTSTSSTSVPPTTALSSSLTTSRPTTNQLSTSAASTSDQPTTASFPSSSTSSTSTETSSSVSSSQGSYHTSVPTTHTTTSQEEFTSSITYFKIPTLPTTQSSTQKPSMGTSITPRSTRITQATSHSPSGPVCTVCSSTDGTNCDTNVQMCEKGECQTQLIYQANGDLIYLSKSCVPTILCQTNIHRNDPVLCDESRANKSSVNDIVCTYCCDPSKSTSTPCNGNLYPDNTCYSSVSVGITTEPVTVMKTLNVTSLSTNPNGNTTMRVVATNAIDATTDTTNSSISGTPTSMSPVSGSVRSTSTPLSNSSTPIVTRGQTTIKTTKPSGIGGSSSSWHTKAGSTICMACLDTVDNCDSLYAPVTCEEPNNYCINFMKNSDRGVTTVNRTCGDINRCYREWFQGSSDNDKCQQYMDGQIITVEFECTYCCIKDNCNAKISPDKDTLYNDL